MQEQIEVKVVADFRDGNPVFESVPATRVGENRYKLLGSPGFAPGIAKGDEIELDSNERMGYRVVSRGGNVCLQMFLGPTSQPARQEIAALIAGIGGDLDGGFDGEAGHLLIFSIPAKAGFRAIEDRIDEISRNFAIDRWLYGNVYDTKDGITPLNWW